MRGCASPSSLSSSRPACLPRPRKATRWRVHAPPSRRRSSSAPTIPRSISSSPASKPGRATRRPRPRRSQEWNRWAMASCPRSSSASRRSGTIRASRPSARASRRSCRAWTTRPPRSSSRIAASCPKAWRTTRPRGASSWAASPRRRSCGSRATARSAISAVPGAGIDSVLGLAVDSPRRVLYAVEHRPHGRGRKERRNSIFAFDLDSGACCAGWTCPAAVGLQRRGDRTGRTGLHHGLREAARWYEVSPRKAPPRKRWWHADELRGSQRTRGIARRDTPLRGRHTTGLAVVDLAKGGVKRVANATQRERLGHRWLVLSGTASSWACRT